MKIVPDFSGLGDGAVPGCFELAAFLAQGHGPANLRVEESEDGIHWATRDHPLAQNARTSAVCTLWISKRKVRLDVTPDVPIRIRIRRKRT